MILKALTISHDRFEPSSSVKKGKVFKYLSYILFSCSRFNFHILVRVWDLLSLYIILRLLIPDQLRHPSSSSGSAAHQSRSIRATHLASALVCL